MRLKKKGEKKRRKKKSSGQHNEGSVQQRYYVIHLAVLPGHAVCRIRAMTNNYYLDSID